MKRMIRNLSVVLAAVILLSGCAASDGPSAEKPLLDPENPVTVTVWNYYNGDQLAAFDKLVEEFNATAGVESGVVVVSASQGDIGTLADALLDSAAGKAGAAELPTLAAVYAETAYILDQEEFLAPFDPYFTEQELSAYVPGFLEEGRFNAENELLLFPICKSTEVFTVNVTDFEPFSKATGIGLDSITTIETLGQAAKAYYEWTDSLTPNVAEDGKALYGRDAMANYIYLGSYQLGHELFAVENGKLQVDLDRATFKTLWDQYYLPYINGYFGAYAKFRSEDAKTGKILALTSSSTGMGYMPMQVTGENDVVHNITTRAVASLPFENAVNDAVVQQGASFCLMRSSEAEQLGAVEFLKWVTEPERNLQFSLESGYSPVTSEVNTPEAITAAYKGDTSSPKGQLVLDTLIVSADVFTNRTSYANKPFAGGKEVRVVLDRAMQSTAAADREAVVERMASGMTRAEATAPYLTEEYFNAWFDELSAEIAKLTQT